MPSSEFAYISGSSPIVQMMPSKPSKTPIVQSEPAKVSNDYDYDSDDEIAVIKAEQSTRASSTKSSILSKVKAKLQSDKQPRTAPSTSSLDQHLKKKQARADTLFAYKVLAESRM
ncbi:hypothetical protein TruAng_008152 [Truncatella angustata]|nr:hypothetical protein TruAng_008152 [Truncatella angustata]